MASRYGTRHTAATLEMLTSRVHAHCVVHGGTPLLYEESSVRRCSRCLKHSHLLCKCCLLLSDCAVLGQAHLSTTHVYMSISDSGWQCCGIVLWNPAVSLPCTCSLYDTGTSEQCHTRFAPSHVTGGALCGDAVAMQPG